MTDITSNLCLWPLLNSSQALLLGLVSPVWALCLPHVSDPEKSDTVNSLIRDSFRTHRWFVPALLSQCNSKIHFK